ncbi:hypothetical protein PRIPAC_82488 [Pristionchus pacificus]|uniref:Uncharacterized protein n=1 Tax=Pristionchus pacificus TaxID=54126 RepID=A0A2A6CQ26_PRIPA|nr:hypothetical protein PRIPAC_82488 [Pristionchus pacificus]|eukprot:PDM80157.1 hypothetical protein PRIPAC_32736 [Pristionchus pacificus]
MDSSISQLPKHHPSTPESQQPIARRTRSRQRATSAAAEGMRALCEHESQLEREERLKADRERKRKRRHSMNDNEREDKGAEDTERATKSEEWRLRHARKAQAIAAIKPGSLRGVSKRAAWLIATALQ